MKTRTRLLSLFAAVILCVTLFQSFVNNKFSAEKFPYKQAGLTERQAAAHLLNRFTYGPGTGDIDQLVETGLENWFKQQLDAREPDAELNKMLRAYDAINLSNTEVVNTYPQMNQVLRMAAADGIISKDSLSQVDRKAYRSQLEAYMKQKGLKPQQELFKQFISQKILRATYTNNQLQEVLTDFWFNHFNVSLNKNQCAEFVPAYERDVIRPHVFGEFGTLLLATAKSPAMLMYLDNSSSMAVNNKMQAPVTVQGRRRAEALSKMQGSSAEGPLKKLQERRRAQGLNENYAREVMELHTLGVDGGYTQKDVTEAARVLTGWTVYPMRKSGYASQMKQAVERMGAANLEKRGFVQDGDFLFAANRHDVGEKTVLGRKFPAGGGYEEGVSLLNMLARHPATAEFISRKLAVRFVNDNPPQALIDRMAKTFMQENGNIKQVLITMVQSPEFWSKEALREKTKSPFELAISAVRSLNAEIRNPYQLYGWITKMGQRMYFYQAPTGFPDRGQYWINTGALLNRMNFGLALAYERIPGIRTDLAAVNKNREPESAQAALAIYSKLMMPERDLNETVKRLTPMLNEPNLASKVRKAADKSAPAGEMAMMTDNEDPMLMDETPKPATSNDSQTKAAERIYNMQRSTATSPMLAQVVGVIIGSPEFQRK